MGATPSSRFGDGPPSEFQGWVDEAVRRAREAGTDLRGVEIKAAAGGLPRSVRNSVCAFANTQGGVVILGLSDSDFRPVPVDVARLANDLASTCAEDLEPPIRPDIDVAGVDGCPVVVALVDELPAGRKPCYVRRRGLEGGTYTRTHDGDRRLSTYEIHVLMSGRGQPRDDVAVVEGARPSDLDEDLVAALLSRVRRRRGPALAGADDEELLRMHRVLVGGGLDPSVTLAGLMALGRYPQQFVPQLNVTFVAFPTINGEPFGDGTRFLDNESIDGSIPVMVAMAQAAVRRNSTRRAVVSGAGRQDVWEYPDEAVREVVVNALLHRDYHPLAQGAQVRIETYPDRLAVTNPGGFHGDVNRSRLFTEPHTSSRNSYLAKLLEDVEIPRTNRTVCENRGSGLVAVARELRAAGNGEPELADRIRETTMTIRSGGYAFRRSPQSEPADAEVVPCQRTETQVTARARPSPSVPAATDPRVRIRELLAGGPLPTRTLAEALAMTPQGALKHLRWLEEAGEIEQTEPARRSPLNRWRLTEAP
ncbi:MAG: putative DNA binding domain-containing protein [bacterium]|nr:putative DNA binding domain-containing protein [bacterium]MDE0667492.1 putative DNA binding domain-containing protein [bacterium]